MVTPLDYDMHFIAEGEGSVVVGDQSLTMKSGDIAFYPPGTRLQLSSSTESPLTLIVVHFDAFPVDRSNRLEKQRSPELGLVLPICTPGPAPQSIFSWFESLVACDQNSDPTTRLLRSRAALFGILEYLYSKSQRVLLEGRTSPRDFARIRKVQKAMRSRMSHAHSIADLAQLVDLSPTYFSELFRRVTGEAPKTHLLRMRLQKAGQLLRETNTPIKQIALQTGFRTEHYFNRAFAKHLGVPPGRYRNGQEIL